MRPTAPSRAFFSKRRRDAHPDRRYPLITRTTENSLPGTASSTPRTTRRATSRSAPRCARSWRRRSCRTRTVGRASLTAELYKKTYEAGILPGVVGAPRRAVSGLNSPSPRPRADYFLAHRLGRVRAAANGVLWGLLGACLGLPGVELGSKKLRERVGTRVLKGEGTVCLYITEPYAGSDVANIRCVAKKWACGNYSVSGEKSGSPAACGQTFHRRPCARPGHGGISLLVVEDHTRGDVCLWTT